MYNALQHADLMLGKFGFEASYKVAFAVSRVDSKTLPMGSGQLWTTQAKGYSAVAVTGTPGHLFWFLFSKVPRVQGQFSLRYNKAEMDAFIDEYRDMKLCNEYTVGEAWSARVKGNMVAEEEGILDQWSRGRVVLIGDSVHKVRNCLGNQELMRSNSCSTDVHQRRSRRKLLHRGCYSTRQPHLSDLVASVSHRIDPL